MTNLALKSVLHGCRRYLPVGIAVGVSGLMMVVQAALAMGAFSLSAAPVRLSQADLWIGPADAMSLDESRGLSQLAVGRLWLDPDIVRIEAYMSPPFVTIGEDEDAGEIGFIVALQLGDDTMLLARAIPAALRQRLADPGTIILDRTDARKLGVAVGDRLRVSGQSLRVVALAEGVQAMFGTQIIASELTARDLGQGAGSEPAFYLARLRPGADPQAVAARLENVTPLPEYRVWLPGDLAAQTVRSWALGSGAGTLFVASSAIALVITLMVVSQTLGAAVASAMREYAALRAYGISFRAVQWIVTKQGLYVCVAALVLTAVASMLVLWVLHQRGVASELPLPLAGAVSVALVLTVVISNLVALRRLRRADPASLLR
ncbi:MULTISPECIES: ABC transporter permease [unclassified Yoonia]|uniref:ABC transporter permease n=1 Tax=unclassified Yoonia TaxID=2629118 RepID=UPI002AFF2ACA|nr:MULTISPECIES: FtsX-like permease family protein [unclassified Yoonia]